MSKKIIVAGLGHGGIAAAAMLADAGYDVTVYEMKAEGTLGYDWTDIFDPKALKIAKIPMPDEDKYEYKEDMTFVSSNGFSKLYQHVPHDELEIKMERKDIYDHLIKNAVDKGVKIVYECEIQKPIMLGNRVAGIRTSKGDFFADLIIDACGMNSPVRRNLPSSLMIQKEITRQQKVTIYRAFYNKASDVDVADKFKVLLRPQGTESIAWVASEEEHTDLLIGRFEDYDMDDVEEFAEWLRPDNPRLGTEVVRGGQFVEIPVRHPLSVMVADGYAAIGDSAFMTVPLIGSGIANSLKAARILAETVINDPTQGFGVESLWKYQVLFFKHLGTGLAPLECVKNLMFKFTPEDLDYCFTSGLLTDYNVTMTANFGSFYDVIDFFDVNDLLNKAKQACSDITFLKKFINAGNKISLVTATCLAIPRRWDRKLVEIWAKGYDKIF